MKKRVRKFRLFHVIILVALICIVGNWYTSAFSTGVEFISNTFHSTRNSNYEIETYAAKNGIDLSEYPDSLITLYERNSDTKNFVLEYPLKKNMEQSIDLSKYENCSTVPLLMQWDQDWGYTEYAGEVMGLSGCGPTCLSMVAIYMTGKSDYNPKAIAEFATENDYYVEGNGTKWTLFTEGAKMLGLQSKELPLDETRVINNLEAGNPIICAMGPGDFTTTGHFIVMVGYVDGKIKVNDPNSYDNSEKLWDYDDLVSQIKNLWVFY